MRSSSIAVLVAGFVAVAEAKPQQSRFMAHPIWNGALPERPHGEMLRLATSLGKSHRVPAMKSDAAYVRWVNQELGPNLRRDQQDLAKLSKLAAGLTGDDHAFASILLAFATDARVAFMRKADAADPHGGLNASAGIGLDDHARQANAVVALATRCAHEVASTSAPLSEWAARCVALGETSQKIVDDNCAQAKQIGVAKAGTFCGDRTSPRP